jgi:anti-anti-sigma factor
MHDSKVFHASHEGVHVLRFVGDIRYTLSQSLECFIEQLFAGEKPRGFIIDLCEVVSIDSTNLGLMAWIANQMRTTENSHVTIICDQLDINELLASMGFDEVFDIVNSRTAGDMKDEEIQLETSQSAAMSGTILKAHRTLMALNETNRELFRDVVTLLEKNDAGGADDSSC